MFKILDVFLKDRLNIRKIIKVLRIKLYLLVNKIKIKKLIGKCL